MMPYTFAIQVLACKQAHSVAADLAHERSIGTAAGGPYGHVGGRPTGEEHDLTERVTTTQQFGIGANQYVPREVTNDSKSW
jgi:hypothetical protein